MKADGEARPRPGAPGAAAGKRTAWVDVARGIGIILVVYGHALRGLVSGGWLKSADWAPVQDRAIYAFHMPLFFVLAGLFLERAVLRGRWPFLADKLVTIVYPYLLWSLINGGLQVALPQEVNLHITPAWLGAILWRPLDQFWFLYALLLCQLIAMVCLPRLPLLLLATAAGLAAYRWSGFVGIGPTALFELPFVAIGIMLARTRLTRIAPTLKIASSLLIGGWIVYLLLLVASPGDSLAARYGVALAGCAGTIGLAMLAGGRAGWLAALGRASMAIYVMHVIFTGGLRIVANHVWPALDPVALLIASTAFGLAGPLLLFEAAQRRGLSTWLGLGKALDRGPALTAR